MTVFVLVHFCIYIHSRGGIADVLRCSDCRRRWPAFLVGGGGGFCGEEEEDVGAQQRQQQQHRAGGSEEETTCPIAAYERVAVAGARRRIAMSSVIMVEYHLAGNLLVTSSRRCVLTSLPSL